MSISSYNNLLSWYIEIACYCAVDVYAIITGYLCIKAKHRTERIIELWVKVFFYSFILNLIFGLITKTNITLLTFLEYAFPISSNHYWYFSSYFIVFLFIPYLNTLINNLNKKQHIRLIIIIVFISTVFQSIGKNLFQVDHLCLKGGYGFLWLIFLYIIGAYIRLYPIDVKKSSNNIFIFSYFFIITLTYILRIIEKYARFRFTGTFLYNTEGLFVSYLSPFILLSAICLVLFFSNLNIKRYQKIIMTLSNLSFGIYLLNENKSIKKYFIINHFSNMTYSNYLLLDVLLHSIIFLIIAFLIELIREKVYKMLKLNKIIINTNSIIKKVGGLKWRHFLNL